VLLDPQYNTLVDLVSMVPIESFAFDASATVPTEEAIRKAKYNLIGSPDVVDGYELVDGAKLLSKDRDKDAQESGLLVWADQWNRSIMRDCASSHLTNAISICIGCISITDKALATHLLKDAGPWSNILSSVLDRMDCASALQRRAGSLDDALHTTATRNLARAIFMITDLLSNNNADSAFIYHACTQISRLIASSGESLMGGPGAARKTERIAILASALARLLEYFAPNQLQMGDFRDFQEAAIVLARLATKRSNDAVPFRPQPDGQVSRACLSLLFRLFASPGGQDGTNFCRTVLTESGGPGSALIADRVVHLVALLDDDIASLLLTIVELRDGADILIERRILHALRSAAENYVREEAAYLSSSAVSMAYQTTEISTPSFFQGHVRLMSALMVSQGSSSNGKTVADMISRTLDLYSPLIERLVSKFPQEGDVLQLVVKCVAHVHLFSSGENRGIAQSLMVQPVVSKARIVSESIETRITVLTMHIAENPLPLSLQRPLPSHLEHQQRSLNSTVVATSSTVTKTWWDGLNLDGTVGNVDEICRLTTLGIETVRDGLIMVRRSQSCFQSIGMLSILRALCRCVDAVKVSYEIDFDSSIHEFCLTIPFFLASSGSTKYPYSIIRSCGIRVLQTRRTLPLISGQRYSI
jgi:hypothetical protein